MVPLPSPVFRARHSLGLRWSLGTMPRATALGALGPLLLLLLLLLPLPRHAEGLGERSDAVSDYSALDGEESAEQQLEHYHDPCKAGRCRRHKSGRSLSLKCKWGGGQACAAVCGAGLPSLPSRSLGFPGKTMSQRNSWNATRAGTSGSPVCGALRWQPRECSRSESGQVPEAEKDFKAGEGTQATWQLGGQHGLHGRRWAGAQRRGWARRSQAQMQSLAPISRYL